MLIKKKDICLGVFWIWRRYKNKDYVEKKSEEENSKKYPIYNATNALQLRDAPFACCIVYLSITYQTLLWRVTLQVLYHHQH